jgi:hypothetical protein
MLFVGFIIAISFWFIGKRLETQSKKLPTWDNDFCVLPGVNEQCFIYEYDLPTQERRDIQFWAMVDFVNEQSILKKREV